jgi:flagellar biosynthesis/type III secretory pathway protein FliH
MATTSTAVVCNTLLWSIILELLENAKTKAFDEGRKGGYSEGYDEGRYLANEDERRDEEKARNTAFEEGKMLGRKEGLENKKDAEERAYEKGWREGHEAGLEEGREEREVKYELAYTEGKAHGQIEERNNWVSNHSKGLCTSPEVSTP